MRKPFLSPLYSTRRRSGLLLVALLAASLVGVAPHALATTGKTRDARRSHGAGAQITPTPPVPPARRLSDREAIRHPIRAQIHHAHLTDRPGGFGPCAGNFAGIPTAVLELSEATSLQIHAESHNGSDATLAILHPKGEWTCLDDGANGVDPSGRLRLEAGEHVIYAGAYERGQDVDLTISIHDAPRPDWGHCEFSQKLSVTPNVHTSIDGRVDDNLAPCDWVLEPHACLWQLTEVPVACVDVSAPLAVEVRTERASFDTTLLVQRLRDDATLDNARFLNDDADIEHTTSAVQFIATPGRYAIFVGAYHPVHEGTYRVRIQTRVPENTR